MPPGKRNRDFVNSINECARAFVDKLADDLIRYCHPAPCDVDVIVSDTRYAILRNWKEYPDERRIEVEDFNNEARRAAANVIIPYLIKNFAPNVHGRLYRKFPMLRPCLEDFVVQAVNEIVLKWEEYTSKPKGEKWCNEDDKRLSLRLSKTARNVCVNELRDSLPTGGTKLKDWVVTPRAPGKVPGNVGLPPLTPEDAKLLDSWLSIPNGDSCCPWANEIAHQRGVSPDAIMKRVSHLLHQICYALKDDLDEKEKDLLEEWIAKTDATRNVPWTGELSERLGKTKAALRMMLIRLLDKLGKLLEEYVKEACRRTDDDATEH